MGLKRRTHAAAGQEKEWRERMSGFSQNARYASMKFSNNTKRKNSVRVMLGWQMPMTKEDSGGGSGTGGVL